MLAYACISRAQEFTVPVNTTALAFGPPGAQTLRICSWFGTRTDPRDGSRMAAFNLSSGDGFFGPCPSASFNASIVSAGDGALPSQIVIDDFQPLPPNAVGRFDCTAPSMSMPMEMQGSALTDTLLLPLDTTIPIALLASGRTTVDAGGIYQSILFGALHIKLCAYNWTQYRLGSTGGTVPPVRASARTGVSWYHVRFGDPRDTDPTPGVPQEARVSTCALAARVPSILPGKDDLVMAIGLPGAPCPRAWSQGAGVIGNVTFQGYYTAAPASAAFNAAITWGQLALTLLVGALLSACFLPSSES